MERAGHWPIEWIEYHRARQATREEAAELEIPTSMWVLEIVRVGRSGKTHKPVEVTVYVIPADRIETVQVLDREETAKAPWPD
jgi:DNA-binding GntR family transcriptional regulator